jgi:hypothetical protein
MVIFGVCELFFEQNSGSFKLTMKTQLEITNWQQACKI